MKKIYEQPEMTTLQFEVMDIVTLSTETNEPGDNQGTYDEIFG